MNKITKIATQKRDKHRFSVFLDGEYAFSVHEDVLVKHRIFVDQQVDLHKLKQIMQDEEKHALQRSGLHFLSYRPRTTWEVKQYWQRKGYATELMDDVLNEWITKGYVDDEAFAQQWVQERLLNKRKGRHLLREELKQKGIADEQIHRAIEQMDDQVEYDACLHIAQKKMATLSSESDAWQKKHKLFRYLQGRGFPLGIIEYAYQTLMEDEV